ncbi:hypothetical protein B0H13DRAFT_2446361 [Mycena leptocephala]|nr:hypothetical protein B0H13DRAFT_2446361 [Mycena leptocephala]
MPPQVSVTQIRLNNITTCLALTVDTVELLASSLNTPFLEAISNTTQSLLKNIQCQTIKQNKNTCTELLEEAYKLLNAVLMVHLKSDTGGALPPSVLSYIGKFTETLHKIHTFVEAQQNGSKVKSFFRQGEMSTLLKECKAGLQQGCDIFQIETANIIKNMTEMQQDAESRHKAVLTMIKALSGTTSSDGASSVGQFQSFSKSSNDFCPDKQGLFGLSQQLKALPQSPCYHLNQRYSMAEPTQVELAALIGTHLGLKPGKDLTHPVIQHFSSSPPSLLILDNLETLWEPVESQANIEEFLSLLTGVEHLALVPLKPLEQDAARQTFIDIADNTHNPEEVDKVLSLTDNMPLAINLLAHLVDSEGSSDILSRWEEEKTSLISEGYDKRSNLDLSISLSLSSTRLDSFPHSKELLSLLSMLPDGLSDVELVQAKLPIDNILGCKAALIRTTLAYSDGNKRLKVLVPIREYMQKVEPPGFHLVRPLLKHFKELLELYMEYRGTQSSSAIVARISSNYSNIQNILWNGAQQGHLDLVNTIYCACDLNYFKTLVLETLEHFKHFNDPDLKCRLYNALTDYYRQNFDISTAIFFCEASISLALSTGNTKMQSQALICLAWINWSNGNYFTAQVHVKEAQRLARISADLFREGQALDTESLCCSALGNYKQSIFLSSRARDLLALCGMSKSHLDHKIMTTQAEIHKLKSEYVAARSIHFMILQEISVDQDLFTYGFALLNVAEIDVSIGAPKEDVQSLYEKARGIFNTHNLVIEVRMCDAILADLYLREGNLLEAKTLFESCLKSSFKHPEIMAYCLERLGDMSRWGTPNWMSGWTTVFLVHSLRQKEKLGIHKALQFLGDAFLAQDDEHTAINLFIFALEGFTWMDVHRSRAECMLRLGDISKGHGDLLNAVEHWETARPLFEQSSQAKQVEKIDQRLAGVDEDVLEKHRTNIACLAELAAPSGTVDEINNLSDIEDMEGLDLEDEIAPDPVAP